MTSPGNLPGGGLGHRQGLQSGQYQPSTPGYFSARATPGQVDGAGLGSRGMASVGTGGVGQYHPATPGTPGYRYGGTTLVPPSALPVPTPGSRGMNANTTSALNGAGNPVNNYGSNGAGISNYSAGGAANYADPRDNIEAFTLDPEYERQIPERIRAQFHRDDQGRLLFFSFPPMDVLPPRRDRGRMTSRVQAGRLVHGATSSSGSGAVGIDRTTGGGAINTNGAGNVTTTTVDGNGAAGDPNAVSGSGTTDGALTGTGTGPDAAGPISTANGSATATHAATGTTSHDALGAPRHLNSGGPLRHSTAYLAEMCRRADREKAKRNLQASIDRGTALRRARENGDDEGGDPKRARIDDDDHHHHQFDHQEGSSGGGSGMPARVETETGSENGTGARAAIGKGKGRATTTTATTTTSHTTQQGQGQVPGQSQIQDQDEEPLLRPGETEMDVAQDIANMFAGLRDEGMALYVEQLAASMTVPSEPAVAIVNAKWDRFMRKLHRVLE